MKDNLKNLEILSPAGNKDSFYAAINSGADAIYLGLSSFNARMKAENFTKENIRDFVRYAHSFGVKIYITLNTLITDNDFYSVVDLVKILTEAKVDAFIVQDFGIAYLLKKCFKNITIHASTQMGIHNLDGAKIAEKIGITRIVLSRETKLEDIKQIKQNTNLEIEYFVQGALCVAFSGNCYLSSLEKNMSGNEGKCLQLCRLPYKNNLNNETSYNLSTRDLSLLENLPELIDAGVTSFKIEGRMRHAGYCAITTKIYKDALNLICKNEFTQIWAKNQEKFLRESFSRGEFNKNAYLNSSTPDNIINKEYQNHIGIKIGKVISVDKFKNDLYKVRVNTNIALNSGDGIKIINEKSKEQVASLGIGNISKIDSTSYEFITKYKFSPNLSVFLTQNRTYEEKILSQKRKNDLNISITALKNKKMQITCESILADSVISLEYTTDFVLEEAKTTPLSKEDFYNQFNKLEESIFTLIYFSVETDGVFIPKSILNQIRRTIIEKMQDKIIDINEQNSVIFDKTEFEKLNQNNPISKPKNIAIIDEYFDINMNSLEKFDIVVFSPKLYNLSTINKFYEILKDKFALNLPTILNSLDKKILNEILNNLPKNIYLYSNNIYGLNYTNDYNIIASPLMNIKNKFALLLLNELKVKIICASIEADENFISNYNLINFTEGSFPLMTFAHCPIKTIFNNTCKDCKYSSFELSNPNLNSYKIFRRKIYNCYFELNTKIFNKKSKFSIFNFSKC